VKQKVMRVGNSLGVVVPAKFVKVIGMKPGDKVEVFLREEKREIVYKFSGIQQLSFSLKKSSPLK